MDEKRSVSSSAHSLLIVQSDDGQRVVGFVLFRSPLLRGEQPVPHFRSESITFTLWSRINRRSWTGSLSVRFPLRCLYRRRVSEECDDEWSLYASRSGNVFAILLYILTV